MSEGESRVRPATLQGLLLTKQTVREKDISNRHILERAIQVLKE